MKKKLLNLRFRKPSFIVKSKSGQVECFYSNLNGKEPTNSNGLTLSEFSKEKKEDFHIDTIYNKNVNWLQKLIIYINSLLERKSFQDLEAKANEKKLIQLRTKLEFYKKLDKKLYKILNSEIEVKDYSDDVYEEIHQLELELADFKYKINLPNDKWNEDEIVE